MNTQDYDRKYINANGDELYMTDDGKRFAVITVGHDGGEWELADCMVSVLTDVVMKRADELTLQDRIDIPGTGLSIGLHMIHHKQSAPGRPGAVLIEDEYGRSRVYSAEEPFRVVAR